MWSYVQYSRIGKQVEDEYGRKSGRRGQSSTSEAQGIEGNVSNRASSLPDEASRSQTPYNGTDSTTEALRQPNKYLVSLNGDGDPLDPRNWTLADRCKNIAILNLLVFVQGWVRLSSTKLLYNRSQS
jgi:DHA1 family multidrug resistance protein-like MFS transporter